MGFRFGNPTLCTNRKGWATRPPEGRIPGDLALTRRPSFDAHKSYGPWRGFRTWSCRTSGGGGFWSDRETATRKFPTRTRAQTQVDRRPATPRPSARSATAELPDCRAGNQTATGSLHGAAPTRRAARPAARIHSARPALLWARGALAPRHRRFRSWLRAAG